MGYLATNHKLVTVWPQGNNVLQCCLLYAFPQYAWSFFQLFAMQFSTVISATWAAAHQSHRGGVAALICDCKLANIKILSHKIPLPPLTTLSSTVPLMIYTSVWKEKNCAQRKRKEWGSSIATRRPGIKMQLRYRLPKRGSSTPYRLEIGPDTSIDSQKKKKKKLKI